MSIVDITESHSICVIQSIVFLLLLKKLRDDTCNLPSSKNQFSDVNHYFTFHNNNTQERIAIQYSQKKRTHKHTCRERKRNETIIEGIGVRKLFSFSMRYSN